MLEPYLIQRLKSLQKKTPPHDLHWFANAATHMCWKTHPKQPSAQGAHTTVNEARYADWRVFEKGWLPSTFPKSHLQIYLVAETSETGRTNVKNVALSKWGPYEIPAAFIHSLDVGNRVWPPDSSSHAGDEETTTKWHENMIPNVLKNHTQLRNDHQRKNVKRSITARDRQQVQDTGSALWIEKFPEHIGHNQGQRAYQEQADQGCSQAPTQNYSFNSSAGVGYVQDETKTM